MGRVALGTVSGLLTGALLVILIGMQVEGYGPHLELSPTWIPQGASLDLSTIIRTGVRSAVFVLIWIFVWIGTGALMGIRGVDFGITVRLALGDFEGRRVVIGIAVMAAILVIVTGLSDFGWLWFAVVAIVYAISALALVAVGTTIVGG